MRGRWKGTDGGWRRGGTHILPAECSDSDVARDERNRRKVRKRWRGEKEEAERERWERVGRESITFAVLE